MAKTLLNLIPAGLFKPALVSALLLATSYGSLAQNFKPAETGQAQVAQNVSDNTFGAYFEARKTGKKPVSNNNARAAALSMPQNSAIYYPAQSGTGWVLFSHGRYTYDGQGNQTSFTNLPLTALPPVTKDSTLYDTNGNLTFDAHYTFNQAGSSWSLNNGDRYFYAYNAAGNITEKIWESWDFGTWKKINKRVTSYNTAGFPIDETVYGWQNNVWVPVSKTIFNYTVATNPPTSMLRQNYSNGTWTDVARFNNVSWHNFLKMEITNYESQLKVGNIWENANKETNVYDALGGYVNTLMKWNGLIWVNFERTTVTHDAKMNYIGVKTEKWQNNLWEYRYESQEVLTYNAADQITERISRDWDPINNMMAEHRKEVYSNFRVLGVKNALITLDVKAYPNPATDFLHMQFTGSGPAKAVLTDFTGRVVLTENLQGASNRRLNVAGLAKGTYVLKLETKNGQSLQKIVKE